MLTVRNKQDPTGGSVGIIKTDSLTGIAELFLKENHWQFTKETQPTFSKPASCSSSRQYCRCSSTDITIHSECFILIFFKFCSNQVAQVQTLPRRKSPKQQNGARKYEVLRCVNDVEIELKKYLMVGGLLPFLGIGKGNRKRKPEKSNFETELQCKKCERHRPRRDGTAKTFIGDRKREKSANSERKGLGEVKISVERELKKYLQKFHSWHKGN